MKKMNALIAIGICLLLTTMSGCNDAENPAEPKPDAEALNSFTDTNLGSLIQHFTINAATGGQLTGNQGTILEFSANAFITQSGEAVTGTVDIEFVEIYSRSSMLLTQKTTTGKTDDGDKAMLVSGGEFYVMAKKDGTSLKPNNSYSIIAPTDNTGGPDNDMTLFDGIEECEQDICNLVWVEQEERGIDIGEFQNEGGLFSAYYAIQSKFGWTNIDRWYNDPRPKTTIFVEVPEGYNNENCAVFIAYAGEPAALGRFDVFDDETRRFTEHYGLIPVGLDVHIILISIIDDEIHYAIKSTTITENHVEIITEVQSITQEDLISLIDNFL